MDKNQKNAAHDEWVEEVMAAVQEYASTWASVGGPFDGGDTMERALASKFRIVEMLYSPPNITD